MSNINTQLESLNVGQSELYQRLLDQGCRFDFFQAVWLLERYLGLGAPIGRLGPVGHESLRFRAHLDLAFPSTDVRSVKRIEDAGGGSFFHLLEVTFMGLYGTATPLPLHYAVDILRTSEDADEAMKTLTPATEERYFTEEQAASTAPITSTAHAPSAASSAVRDFLDIFHHRLISLFYRSWLKYRYERAFGSHEHDVLTQYLTWLMGLSPHRDEVHDEVSAVHKIRYAGVWTQHPRSGPMLEGLLQDYWDDTNVRVETCVGRWVVIPESQQNRLGVTKTESQRNVTQVTIPDTDQNQSEMKGSETPPNRLGATGKSLLNGSMCIGAEVYDISGAFCVSFHPLSWEQYLEFLPDGIRYKETSNLIRHYCEDPLAVYMELCVKPEEVPPLELYSPEESSESGLNSTQENQSELCSTQKVPRLGYTTWVGCGTPSQCNVVFDATGKVWPASRPGASAEGGQRDFRKAS